MKNEERRKELIDIESIINAINQQNDDKTLILITGIKSSLDVTIKLIQENIDGVIKRFDNLSNDVTKKISDMETIIKDVTIEIRDLLKIVLDINGSRKLVENNLGNELTNIKVDIETWQAAHCTAEEHQDVISMRNEYKDKKGFKKKVISESKLKFATSFSTIIIVIAGNVLTALVIALIMGTHH